MADIISLVDELSKLSKEKDSICEKYDEVEAEILKLGEVALRDSKEKSITYVGSGSNRVTFTKSETLKQVYPSLLKDIFGVLYDDVVEEKTTFTISAEGKKMLIDMWLGNYITHTTMEDVIKSTGVDEETQKVLLKKLKGKDPEKDRKTLISVAGLDEKQAEETAYFVAEALAYDSFMAVVNANKTDEDDDTKFEKILAVINNAVMVDEGVKVKVE